MNKREKIRKLDNLSRRYKTQVKEDPKMETRPPPHTHTKNINNEYEFPLENSTECLA